MAPVMPRIRPGFQQRSTSQTPSEDDTRTDSLKRLVADLIEELKAGESPMVIAPIHRDGQELGGALRQAMKAQGMIGKEDHEVTWLESVGLSAAQAKDPICYEPGQIIEFHRQTGPGG